MVVVQSSGNQQLTIMREGDVFDSVREWCPESHNVWAIVLSAGSVPHDQPRREADLSSVTVLSCWIKSHAEDIIIVLHHEPLSVLFLIVDDANARCMIHYFAFAIVPQVVSCVVAPVAVDVLQIESCIRPVEIKDGWLVPGGINL